jgi:hypothetical protein
MYILPFYADMVRLGCPAYIFKFFLTLHTYMSADRGSSQKLPGEAPLSKIRPMCWISSWDFKLNKLLGYSTYKFTFFCVFDLQL